MTEAEIAQANRKLEQALANSDAGAMASLYTKDGVCLPPDGGMAKGHDAIAAMWGGAIEQMGLKTVKLDTVDLEVTGDVACEIGEATLGLADGSQPVAKYVVVWKREDGAWKLHRDIWNAKG